MLGKIRNFLAVSLLALAATATAGPGYEEIRPAQNTSTETGEVEVLEFFWFGCPHCFAFEPTINKWVAEKPEHAIFVREAPPLNPGWTPHSQAFYAAEIMGVTDTLFEPMFNAIHVDKKKLRSVKSIAKFAGSLGIDENLFRETMESFAVETRMRQAMQKARAAGITGVPSIVINGKYRTTNTLAGGHEGIVDVINNLVEQEHSDNS